MPVDAEQSIVIHRIEGFSIRGSAGTVNSHHHHHHPLQNITNNMNVKYEASVVSIIFHFLSLHIHLIKQRLHGQHALMISKTGKMRRARQWER